MILPNKKRANLETKLLMTTHMPRPIFFYIGPREFVLEPIFSNVCGLHMIKVVHLP